MVSVHPGSCPTPFVELQNSRAREPRSEEQQGCHGVTDARPTPRGCRTQNTWTGCRGSAGSQDTRDTEHGRREAGRRSKDGVPGTLHSPLDSKGPIPQAAPSRGRGAEGPGLEERKHQNPSVLCSQSQRSQLQDSLLHAKLSPARCLHHRQRHPCGRPSPSARLCGENSRGQGRGRERLCGHTPRP